MVLSSNISFQTFLSSHTARYYIVLIKIFFISQSSLRWLISMSLKTQTGFIFYVSVTLPTLKHSLLELVLPGSRSWALRGRKGSDR